MADDVLASYSVDRVAAWYRRLALGQIRKTPELQPALAGLFLLKWLDDVEVGPSTVTEKTVIGDAVIDTTRNV